MLFLQFHNEPYIVTWVNEHFWWTLEKEHCIWNRACKWHGNKLQQRTFCFIFVIFLNLDTKFSQNAENQVANLLIFDSRFGKFFPKMQNLSFASQNIYLRRSPITCTFSNAVINIVSFVWSSCFLGVFWKASILFETRYIWGTWKQI